MEKIISLVTSVPFIAAFIVCVVAAVAVYIGMHIGGEKAALEARILSEYRGIEQLLDQLTTQLSVICASGKVEEYIEKKMTVEIISHDGGRVAHLLNQQVQWEIRNWDEGSNTADILLTGTHMLLIQNLVSLIQMDQCVYIRSVRFNNHTYSV